MTGIIEAKDIVNEALMLTNRPQSEYGAVFQLLVNGYRELNNYGAYNIKFEKKEMDGQYMVDYPDDLVELMYAFVPYHGEMRKLTRKDLVPTVSTMYGERTRNVEDGEGEPIPIEVDSNQARPHNVFGYYMQDDVNRWILFLTDYRSEVVLAFKTSGLSAGDTTIPVAYKEVLVNYIVYRDAFLKKDNMNYIEKAERIYESSVRMLNKPVINYEDFMQAWIPSKTVHR